MFRVNLNSHHPNSPDQVCRVPVRLHTHVTVEIIAQWRSEIHRHIIEDNIYPWVSLQFNCRPEQIFIRENSGFGLRNSVLTLESGHTQNLLDLLRKFRLVPSPENI